MRTNLLNKMRAMWSPARMARRDNLFLAAILILFIIAQAYFPAHR